MLQIFLPMLAAVVALLLFAALGTRWAVDWMQRRLLEKQRAADCIINDGQVPEPWIGRFRLRFAEARQAGSSSGELEEVGRRAQQHCLKQLDGLMRHYRTTSLVEDEETRRILLEALQERRDQWASGGWEALLVEQPGPAEERQS